MYKILTILFYLLLVSASQKILAANCTVNSAQDTNISADCEGFTLSSSNSFTVTIDLGVTVENSMSTIFLQEDLFKLDIKGILRSSDNDAALYINQFDKNNTVTLTTLDISGTLGGNDTFQGIYMHNVPTKIGNTLIGNLNNSGSIIAAQGIYMNSRSIITTLNNTGTINSSQYGIYHQGSSTEVYNGYFGTINNSGTINGDTAGIYLQNFTYITNLINTGTISHGGSDTDIKFGSGSPYITNLYNDQGGADALTMNKMPTNYYIIINSASDYGKVNFTGIADGTMNFNIDTSRSASGIDGATYSSVIEGLTSARLSSTSGTSGIYTWTLSDSDNNNTWDLVIDSNAPSASNTMTSVSNLTYATSAVFNSFSYTSSYLNLNSYDCGIFDQQGMCGALFSKLVDSNGDNDTDFDYSAGQMVNGFKFNDNLRVAAFIDQMANNNLPSGVQLEKDSPLVGASTVWNQNKSKLGFEAKIMAAHQSKKITSTRTIVGDAEAGIGKTDVEMKTYMAELSYQYIANDSFGLRPFSGFRYSSIKQNAYSEFGIDNPLTFSAISDKTSTLIFGIQGRYIINNQLMLSGSLGLERDIKNSTSDVNTSSSTISGLTALKLHNGGGVDKTRGSFGANLSYFITEKAKLTFHGNFQELSYHDSDVENFYISYELGF